MNKGAGLELIEGDRWRFLGGGLFLGKNGVSAVAYIFVENITLEEVL